jgi:hypothetical protein
MDETHSPLIRYRHYRGLMCRLALARWLDTALDNPDPFCKSVDCRARDRWARSAGVLALVLGPSLTRIINTDANR